MLMDLSVSDRPSETADDFCVFFAPNEGFSKIIEVNTYRNFIIKSKHELICYKKSILPLSSFYSVSLEALDRLETRKLRIVYV